MNGLQVFADLFQRSDIDGACKRSTTKLGMSARLCDFVFDAEQNPLPLPDRSQMLLQFRDQPIGFREGENPFEILAFFQIPHDLSLAQTLFRLQRKKHPESDMLTGVRG